ncbi:monoglyceride lipase-like [Ischnura elegans]|uniref:monoglyceride lipase-like n=1 Tax=Ischnura elegans TaxID=197161 RepID=UPI001ED8A47D|nr:monoglyceride lipase-like [Ischnura elegans]
MAESESAGPVPVFEDPFLDAPQFTTDIEPEPRLQILDFENQSGTNLYGRYWKPKGRPKALVCMVHGFGEYLITYHEVSTALAQEGCLVFGHDHSGHGKSGGERATASSIEDFAVDVIAHCQKMRASFENTPLFVVGHSMGGMITLLAVDLEPFLFNGIVLVGPFVSMHWSITLPIQKILATAVSRFAPNLTVGRIGVEAVTSDEINRQKIVNDSLWWNGTIKAQMAVAFLNGINRIATVMDDYSIPMLIIHGDKDSLCDLEGSKRLHAASKATDKELKVYPDALHNLYLETKEIREMAVQDTVTWILKRIK